ncbi:MAG: hypothetical protein DRI37_01715 [Chloroflexi bacterium]|nr:MAG: hypothetical protein DRI37_01715 [Chloroflexota bacterium]
MSNGGRVTNISIDKIGRFKAMTPLGAAFIDKRYFLTFAGVLNPSDDLFPSDDLYPGSVVNDHGLALPPGAIVIDFSMGAPAFSTLTDDNMGQMLVAEDELYHISSFQPKPANIVTTNGLYNLVTEDGFNIVADILDRTELKQTIRGSEYRHLTYLSPVLTEGSIGFMKQYEKIRITYTGELTIAVHDEDSRLFIEKTLFSLTRKSEWVGIPVGFNRGYGIQFKIAGKCIVDSIAYTWTPRESQ